jgi:hypoxanthine phosphoribosyltransferase
LKITSQRAREIFDTAEEICPAAIVNAAVSRVAAEINASISDANPLVIVVLRGAVVFAGQLLPQLIFPLDVDSVDATRYGDATRGGDMVFRTLPVSDVAGRTVLLVDDILDEGVTLKAIRDRLLAMQAREVKIAVFADKHTGKLKLLTADYVGVALPDRYVFGFGMDIHGYWRNLPSIYAANEKG